MKHSENNISSDQLSAKDQNDKSHSTNGRSSSKVPPKRCTIDLTPGAASEVERIQKMFNLTMADVFRSALLLMRIYTDAVSQKQEVHIVDPKNPNRIRVVELPFFQ